MAAVIAWVLVLMSLGPKDGHAGNGTVPHLSVRLTNYSSGVKVEVTVDPYGKNGWMWDNPFFYAGLIYYCMDMSTPYLCGGLWRGRRGHGRA